MIPRLSLENSVCGVYVVGGGQGEGHAAGNRAPW